MNIIGKSECTASQMAQYLINKNPNAKSWALEYAQLYLEEGEMEGVRGDGAWIQSCKETGNFMFINTAVTFDQNNFCGLGVTQRGMKGHSFETPRLGIRAQIQHLKGYATSTPLVNPCIDPRYGYISPKGKAPRFEDLAGKWAVPGYDTNKASSLDDAMNKGIGYGFDIIAGVELMKKIVVINTPTKDDNTGNDNLGGNNMKNPVIALSAGHGKNTAGKRCMKAIDSNETREWFLNDRIVDKVETKLKAYNCTVIRVNDTDGNVDTALATRANMSDNANADVYLAIHHNAGINGGSGGGTIVFYYSSNVDRPKQAQQLYNAIVEQTGLVGNRSSKVVKQNLYECRVPKAPAFLVENGFMDSTTDVPIILSESHAEKTAVGVVNFLVDYLKLTKNGTVVPSTSTSNNAAATSSTYTVVAGDTLSKIGQKTGIAWQTIADLNGIKSPYIINIGQVLKLTSTATTNTTSTPSSTKYVYNGIDYSVVFDPTYYTNKYSDLKSAFGTNASSLWNHFKTYGMKEHRQASNNFNPVVYRNNYKDLNNAFGDNWAEYYKHYIQYGQKEKRSAV